jgi:hypothetical protein
MSAISTSLFANRLNQNALHGFCLPVPRGLGILSIDSRGGERLSLRRNRSVFLPDAFP